MVLRSPTTCLIGTHSKSKVVSVFLSKTTIISTDGARWPVLEGIATLRPSLLSQEQQPLRQDLFVRVDCIFVYKTSVGAINNKLLYSVTQPLTQPTGTIVLQEPSALSDLKFRFVFDFGTNALPPSFAYPFETFEGHQLGVRWEVSAFIRHCSSDDTAITNDDVRNAHMASKSFIVSYNYTRIGLINLSILSATQANVEYKPILTRIIPRNWIINDIRVSARLDTAILAQPLKSALSLTLDIGDLKPTQFVYSVKIVFRQNITLQLVNVQQLHFKTEFTVYRKPILPQEPQKTAYKIVCRIEPMDILRQFNPSNAKRTCPGVVLPIDWMQQDSLLSAQFVPSTACMSFVTGIVGMHVEYSLKPVVSITEHFLGISRNREVSVSIPLIVSAFEGYDSSPVLSPRQVLAPTDVPSPDNQQDYSEFTTERFLPVLSELLEDLGNSRNMVSTLISDWKSFRAEAATSERMVTNSSDHAVILLDVLSALDSQLNVFVHMLQSDISKMKRVRWPCCTMPFNVFLLELEFLIRASPDSMPPPISSSVQSTQASERVSHIQLLLRLSSQFMDACQNLVVKWVEGWNAANAGALPISSSPCTMNQHSAGQTVEIVVESYREKCHELCFELKLISLGADTDDQAILINTAVKEDEVWEELPSD